MRKFVCVGIALCGLAALSGSVSAGFDLRAKMNDAKKTKLMSVTGVIRSVNKNTLSLATMAPANNALKTQTQVIDLTMDELTQVKAAGGKKASIGDLLPGKTVQADYTQANEVKTARVVVLVTAGEKKKAPAK